MRAQSNNNADIQQKQTVGALVRKSVQLTIRVMALVRGASMSKTTGMDRGIPLLGIMTKGRLKSFALRITTMPVASTLLFAGRTDNRNQFARPAGASMVCGCVQSTEV